MPHAREILSRYRLLVLAILVSASLHAALIAGTPGRAGPEDEALAAIYTASLESGGMRVEDAAAPAPTPKPAARKPRPKKTAPPPRPEEIVASVPEPPAQPASEPQRVNAPESEAEQKPENVALAPVAAPLREPEPPPPERFPTDALPGNVKITYALSSSWADGRAVYEWERNGDRYTITGEAEAVGFFTLFLEGRIRQESRGKVTAEGLRPERFVERRANAAEEGLEFDWDQGKVTFERGDDKRTAELKDNTVDWLSMIFQLAHKPPKGDSFELRVFTQRRMYQFTLKVLGEEEIEIPIGRIRALHLRHANEAENEYVDVWLGIDQHYVPVKMRYPVARNRVVVEQTATRISVRQATP